MISKEDLEKLTVPQIKEKLKSRKLPVSGSKVELIARLHDNIVAEEKLLGSGEVESAGPSEFDLDIDNVDVDEVLGMLDTDSIDSNQQQQQQKKDLKNSQQAKLAAAAAKPTPPTKKPDAGAAAPATTPREPKKPITAPEGSAPLASPKTAKPKVDATPKTMNEETGTTTTLTTTEAADPTKPKTSGLSSDEEQKMLERAKRLGLPCKTASGVVSPGSGGSESAEDALKKRAERFGLTGDEASNKKQTRAARFGTTTPGAAISAIATDETLKKRAERFGLPVGGGGGAKNGGAEETDKKKQARTERFGKMVSDATPIAVKRPAGTSAEELAALEKRAKRFGIASS